MGFFEDQDIYGGGSQHDRAYPQSEAPSVQGEAPSESSQELSKTSELLSSAEYESRALEYLSSVEDEHGFSSENLKIMTDRANMYANFAILATLREQQAGSAPQPPKGEDTEFGQV